MESFNRPSIIIEFNGLPGTGKTTISRCLNKYLSENGIITLTDFSKNRIRRNHYSTLLNLSCLHLKWILFRYWNTINTTDNRTGRDFVIMHFFRMYKDFLNTKGCVLIKDQGIIQALLSMAHLNRINSSKPLDEVVKYLFRSDVMFVRIDCKTDVNISYDRINSRPTFNARLDNISNDQLMHSLSTQSHNLSIIRDSFNSIYSSNMMVLRIDTNEPYTKNAELIAAQIFKIFNQV